MKAPTPLPITPWKQLQSVNFSNGSQVLTAEWTLVPETKEFCTTYPTFIPHAPSVQRRVKPSNLRPSRGQPGNLIPHTRTDTSDTLSSICIDLQCHSFHFLHLLHRLLMPSSVVNRVLGDRLTSPSRTKCTYFSPPPPTPFYKLFVLFLRSSYPAFWTFCPYYWAYHSLTKKNKMLFFFGFKKTHTSKHPSLCKNLCLCEL